MGIAALNRNPSPRELAWFGWLLPAFVAVSAWLLYRGGAAPWVAQGVVAAGVVLTLAFALVPSWRTRLYVAWMRVVFPIGWIVSHGLLAFIYFLIVTPIGRLLRLTGRDPLRRRIDRSAPTYWQIRMPERSVQHYFRQY